MCQFQAIFGSNCTHGFFNNSKTTGPISDYSTPFSSQLQGLQKLEKCQVSKTHSFLTISYTIQKHSNFENINAYNHATSHRTVLTITPFLIIFNSQKNLINTPKRYLHSFMPSVQISRIEHFQAFFRE